MTRSSAMAEEASAEACAAAPGRVRITVQTKSGTFAYDCAAGEPLLHAGLRHGLTLPYECATGTCGTCRGRVMDGAAEMAWTEAPGGARLKRDKGDVLMCQARPRTDCLVRVPAEIEARPVGPGMPAHRHGRILGLRRLTHDVADFEVALSAPMTFEAGQFVVITAPGLPGGRAYSMVNFARETDRLAFVVKRKPGGGFSEWLFEGMADGAGIEVFGPLGRATFHPEEDRDVLVVAGGSGIAGMMSILSRATAEGCFRNRKGHVFFGVRTLSDGFYLEDLARHVASAHGNLEVTLALSHEGAQSACHPAHPGIRLAEGMVHEVASRHLAGCHDGTIAFAAGPPPMVDATLRMLIAEAGLPPQSIRYDKFA